MSEQNFEQNNRFLRAEFIQAYLRYGLKSIGICAQLRSKTLTKHVTKTSLGFTTTASSITVHLIQAICLFQSYPERFYFEGLLESAGATVPTVQYLPIYFGNVCLRFLPVSAETLLSIAIAC